MTQNTPLTPGEEQALDLGIQLGQRRSFTVLAGRCTAAHAEVLRKIRDDKLYHAYACSWTKYCGPHLKISRRHADRLIAQLNEFGPAYFELAALVGITPAQYRSIEPCIRENALHIGSEVTALIPANSAAIAAAISLLLDAPRHSVRGAGSSLEDRLTRLEGQIRATAEQYEHLLNSRISAHHRERIVESLRSMRILLGSLIPTDL